MLKLNEIYQGDALECLKYLPAQSIDCCITSPPYWGLRDYGVEGQLGLEKTPEEYVNKIVNIFREVKRVLKNDGTVWLNLGDSYWGGKGYSGAQSPDQAEKRYDQGKSMTKKWMQLGGPKEIRPADQKHPFIKPKDLVGIPWMVALALRNDGWYLRQDIIWYKKNPMPESVKDRCTRSHEYIFLLSKSKKYYFDQEAILRECSPNTHNRLSQDIINQIGSERANGGLRKDRPMKTVIRSQKQAIPGSGIKNNTSFNNATALPFEKVNKKSVWEVSTEGFSEAHFATFPQKLIIDCIKAGTSEKGYCSKCGKPYVRILEPSERYKKYLGKSWTEHDKDLDKINNLTEQTRGKGKKHQKPHHEGVNCAEYETKGWEPSCNCNAKIVTGIVLDPFMGSGTTGIVARKLNRNFIGFELNPEYIKIAERRIHKELGIFK